MNQTNRTIINKTAILFLDVGMSYRCLMKQKIFLFFLPQYLLE